MDEAQQLQQEGVLGVGWLVGDDGSIYWSTQNWEVDPRDAVKAWKGGARSFTLGGVKFTIIQETEIRCIATNLQKQGHFFITRCPHYPAHLAVFSHAQNARDVAFAQIAKLAGTVRG